MEKVKDTNKSKYSDAKCSKGETGAIGSTANVPVRKDEAYPATKAI